VPHPRADRGEHPPPPDYVKCWLRRSRASGRSGSSTRTSTPPPARSGTSGNWRIHVVPPFDRPVPLAPFESARPRPPQPDRRPLVRAGRGRLPRRRGRLLRARPRLAARPAIKLTDERTGARGPITADPSVFTASFDGQTVAAEYRSTASRSRPATTTSTRACSACREWLTRRREGLAFPAWHQYAGTLGPDGLGSPLLFVLDTPATQPLRMEIPDYRWRDLSPTQEEKADQPEEPRKKDDHAATRSATAASRSGRRPRA
jgi:hypothetical protein